ncbi:TlpA family protein disulfide reductase [bacterium]|nr:TlpA family protein disulfide reductase [bacterium]
MLRKNLFVLLLLCGSFLLVNGAEKEEKSLTGKTAPAISLQDINGKEVALKDFYGKGPVLISFWATWCKPCIKELVKFKEILEPYQKEGLTIIGIAADDSKSVAKVKPFAKNKGFNFPILLDTEKKAQNAFQVFQIPYTFLLDKDGKILFSHTGFKPGDEKEVEELVKKLIAQK